MKKVFGKRRTGLLLVFVMMFSLLAGCSQPAQEEDTVESGIVLTDQIGREVTLEKPAERIVSSYYISTAILIALGKEDQLVGIEMKADTRNLYKAAAPQLLDLPAVGSGKGINVEETAALEPDLVILPQKLQDSVASFEELGIPVLVVDPETLENYTACVELLGKATGAEETSQALLTYYEDKMAEAAELTGGLSDEERPAVYLSAGSDYLSTCTSKMYQNDLIAMAGGRNVSAELTDGYWQSISAEQLLSWNPAYIFAVNYAEYSLDDIKNDSALAGMDAIENGRVYSFPSDLEPWDYPTPSSVLGILWLTHVLHPDLYTEEAYVAEAEAFYQQFFGIEISRSDLGLEESAAEAA
ncbi:ABC transporter substrate-binding protein [Anaerotignum lactatifermentans]|uniref:ABC transporter substrate-binding protein n=1 Tax=Anaerotignum lactatifermentans TaxID=160404 RepID=A0ABS2GA81_9FIRM|nr:ABC transporter substrate-binding protein [Anaerotignum lactatifermentans]MBM6829429.1 ABC transporter substrate-binding protein [Anaerotignum lactatifermentans]MBM6877787.1 ABC transporter substrate-binding protein [Anaerotignum lactatifermentans]MBM6951006.1 ABC transporter substrate-binding protein [Anaerotignum lactatifermentans]